VLYAAQLVGVSQGRVPDGDSNVYSLGIKGTPGKSNFLDSNGDGLPDAWELAHGLDPFARSNAELDPDGDGVTNLQEFLSGTVFFRIRKISTDLVVIEWNGGFLQSADNTSGPWNEIPGAASPQIIESTGTNEFFRVRF
jgi:hypothetical protein